jgi:RNA recognition motif-containing protein
LLRVEGLTYNKGRCFVEFENKTDAIKAVEALNGKVELKGKLI